MPFLVKCHNCGYILFEGKPQYLTFPLRGGCVTFLDKLIEKHDGRCPKCGAKLSSAAKSVHVLPLECKGGENK